jgi:hypothetical protein
MCDFLPGPPPFGEDNGIVIIAIPIDVSRDLERGGLEPAATLNSYNLRPQELSSPPKRFKKVYISFLVERRRAVHGRG